jgi:hypothetical protein
VPVCSNPYSLRSSVGRKGCRSERRRKRRRLQSSGLHPSRTELIQAARGAGDSACVMWAVARSAGYGPFQSMLPGVPPRFTPGFMLSPAPRARTHCPPLESYCSINFDFLWKARRLSSRGWIRRVCCCHCRCSWQQTLGPGPRRERQQSTYENGLLS